MTKNHRFSVGDWVEVRSKEEILSTLDSDGRSDGMPFMPEMFAFCGKKFEVFKSAHKTCDPDMRSRRIRNAVHLQTRCNGSAHGGCQAGCLIFWNEAWLKSVGDDVTVVSSGLCTESIVIDRTQALEPNGELSYVCQTTRVQYESPLPWWDIRQYFEDYTSRNISLRRLLSGTIYSAYYNLSGPRFLGRFGLGPAMIRLYDKARPIWDGIEWPRKPGFLPLEQPTPTASLNLQSGELVRVKSREEILKTINTDNKNRGLWWDAELAPYCGGTYRVLSRVTKALDERTGKMQIMKTPCIILDSVVCGARYSACRMFCPRNTYAYWREIWLERIDP
jgi:hypothetical protein